MISSEGAGAKFLINPNLSGSLLSQVRQFQEENKVFGLDQYVDWYLARRDQASVQFAVSMDQGEVVCSSIIAERKLPLGLGSIMRVNFGPVASIASNIARHLQSLKESFYGSGSLLVVGPFHDQGDPASLKLALAAAGAVPVSQDLAASYSSTITLALDMPQDQLFRKIRSSVRRQIQKSSRLDIEITQEMSKDCWEEFGRLYNVMAKKRGLKLIGQSDLECLMQMNAHRVGRVALFTSRLNGQLLAAIVLGCVGDRVVYLWGAGSQAHRELPLSHGLHWYAICWAKRHGFKAYDFGGFWQQRGTSDPINRFKAGFSGTIEQLVPEHIMDLHPVKGPLLRGMLQLRGNLRGVVTRLKLPSESS